MSEVFRTGPMKPQVQAGFSRNGDLNRKAWARMDAMEQETGFTAEWWDAFHAENRARVRARYGADT